MALTPECIANHGKGRPLGSKNKKPTKRLLNEQWVQLGVDNSISEQLFNFWLRVMNDPKVKDSVRDKAADNLARRFIVSADMDKYVESKPVIESVEEAFAILNGQEAELPKAITVTE